MITKNLLYQKKVHMILFVEKITLKNKTNKQTNTNVYDVLMQKGKCGFVDEIIKHLSRQTIRLT
jgi:hypothetical protein